MSLIDPCNILQVKRLSILTFDDFTLGTGGVGLTSTGVGGNHFRLLVFRADNAGVTTLILTSDTFVAGPVVMTIGDTNNPVLVNLELAAVDNTFYKIELRDYDDVGETAYNIDDEWYIHCFPDELESQEDEDGSLDTILLSKLLWQLGHNALDSEFKNPGGYTHEKVRRGYPSLTEAEADALLLASDDPGDVNVEYKNKTVRTVTDSGNESVTIEQEQSVS